VGTKGKEELAAPIDLRAWHGTTTIADGELNKALPAGASGREGKAVRTGQRTGSFSPGDIGNPPRKGKGALKRYRAHSAARIEESHGQKGKEQVGGEW